MALYYSAGSRRQTSDKFRPARRMGVQPEARQQCGKYRLELLSMQSNGPLVRTRYHVRIFNDRNHRVAYLRDYLSPAQAFAAAERWVEERIQVTRNGR